MRANQFFLRISIIFIALLFALPLLLSAQGKKIDAAFSPSGQQPIKMDRLILDDTIQPISAGLLDRALALANSDGASALLIELDTPGGLLEFHALHDRRHLCIACSRHRLHHTSRSTSGLCRVLHP